MRMTFGTSCELPQEILKVQTPTCTLEPSLDYIIITIELVETIKTIETIEIVEKVALNGTVDLNYAVYVPIRTLAFEISDRECQSYGSQFILMRSKIFLLVYFHLT